MYEGDSAILQVERNFLKDSEINESIHHCKIIRYIPEEERIYLVIGKTDIRILSLDALYKCEIADKERHIWCSGVIRERYLNKAGKVIVFQVQNGFYKNNLNKIK